MAFNLEDAIAQDTTAPPPKDALKRAILMGELMVQADKEVNRLNDELKIAKARYNKIAMDTLPTLLKELKLAFIGLENGVMIEVKGDLSTSITKVNHDLAMAWLIDNKFGGIIKTNVTVAFSAEEQEAAAEFAEATMLEHDGVIYKAAVHPATLKSFVKEQLAAGTALPLDLFSVHEYSIAKLTQPRG